jgi:hypothetical protein
MTEALIVTATKQKRVARINLLPYSSKNDRSLPRSKQKLPLDAVNLTPNLVCLPENAQYTPSV